MEHVDSSSNKLALFLAYTPALGVRCIGMVDMVFSNRRATLQDGCYSDNQDAFTALNEIFSI